MNDDDDSPRDALAPPRPSGSAAGRRSVLAVLNNLHHRWLVMMFAFAVGCLMVKGDFLGTLLFFAVPPFWAWIAVKSDDTSLWGKRLACAFLSFIVLGTLAATLDLMPAAFNQFPQLPRMQNRILSWYTRVFVLFAVGIVWPYFAIGLTRRSLDVPAGWTIFGWFWLGSWALFMLMLAVDIVRRFL